MKKYVIVTAVAVAAAMTAPVFAQAPQQTTPPPATQTPATPQPPTPAPAQVQPAPQTPVPTEPSVHYVTPGPRVNLSLQDAIQRGDQNNINIGVARINPNLDAFSLAALQANYLPTITSTARDQSQNTPVTNQTQGATSDSLHTGSISWQGGLAQNMKWHGGSYSVGWTNSRVDSSNLFSTRNPTYNSGLTATYTQPLLRNWNIDTTRAALLTTQIAETNDNIGLRTTILSTEASVANAYWDLVYAIQAVDAAQVTLDISNTLVQQNQQRVEIGTLAPIDVTSARAEAANDQLAVVQAQATLRTAELTLKQLIVNGTDDPVWSSSINPVDRPATAPQTLNVDAAIARALKERTDFQQSANNLKISDINLRALTETTRPQLDLVATYGLSGIGGTQFVRSTDALGGAVSSTVPSNYLDALSTLGNFSLPQWTVQANFSMPIGQSSALANVARSKLSLEQSQANLKALQLQIATDVTNAALTVQSTLESAQAATVARQLSKEKLDAAISKAEVGMATNTDVVQAQRDYADAQNAELRAVANYRKALVSYETAQTVGTRAVSSSVTTAGGGSGATSTGSSSSSSSGTTSIAGTSSVTSSGGTSTTSGGGGL